MSVHSNSTIISKLSKKFHHGFIKFKELFDNSQDQCGLLENAKDTESEGFAGLAAQLHQREKIHYEIARKSVTIANTVGTNMLLKFFHLDHTPLLANLIRNITEEAVDLIGKMPDEN